MLENSLAYVTWFIALLSFPGLAAKVIDRTKTMSDVYRAFYDFSCLLKSKVWFLICLSKLDLLGGDIFLLSSYISFKQQISGISFHF